MSWLDVHKKRMVNDGTTIQESHEKNTEFFIETSFADSPTYLKEKVIIDEEEYEARLIVSKRYTVASGYDTKALLFRPHTKVIVGKVAEFHDKEWLIVFFNDRELEPKAEIRLCNNNLFLKNGMRLPCVIDSKASDSQKIKEETFVDLSSDTLKVTIGYDNESKKIKENDRFIINETAFEVQGVNKYSNVYRGEGIIELAMKKVALKEDELPIEAIPLIPASDYYIKIVGDDRIGINGKSQFNFELYIDSVLTTIEDDGSVIWSTVEGEGNITNKGLYSSPSTKGVTTIKVEYHYTDENNEFQVIHSEKEVEIFNPSDWSWGK